MHHTQPIQSKSIALSWRALSGPLAIGLFLLLGLWNLAADPILWDEGWTLMVARNWVEHGYYGQFNAGMPATLGLTAAFPVVAPIALSFWLLGAGLWQARMVGVLMTLAALAATYILARRLHGRRTAVATLAVLLLMSGQWQIHPLLMGRVMWADMPMLCYLMLGYLCWLGALRRPLVLAPLAALAWGVALVSKAQILPFWMLGQIAALALALLGRRWRRAALLAAVIGGVLAIYRLLPALFASALGDRLGPGVPITGLYDVTAVVTEPYVRVSALILALSLGLPALLGMGYAARSMLKNRVVTLRASDNDLIRMSLLVLAGSWFAWYMLLSSALVRYLLPATFVGAIFAAALLSDLTGGFKLRATLGRLNAALVRRRIDRQAAGAGMALLLVLITLPLTLGALADAYAKPPDRSLWETVEALNTATPPDALIETHDAELFFLLRRSYHFPPEQIHVELIRRAFLHQQVRLDYDPLTADPDYLVVGPFNKGWRLYDEVLATGAFQPLQTYGSYTIYQRVRQ